VTVIKQVSGQFYEIQLIEVSGKYTLKLGKVGVTRSGNGLGGEMVGDYVTVGGIANLNVITEAFDEYVRLADESPEWRKRGTVLREYHEKQTASWLSEIEKWRMENLAAFEVYQPEHSGHNPKDSGDAVSSRERVTTFELDGAISCGSTRVWFDKRVTSDGRVFFEENGIGNAKFYTNAEQIAEWKRQLDDYLKPKPFTVLATKIIETLGDRDLFYVPLVEFDGIDIKRVTREMSARLSRLVRANVRGDMVEIVIA
jgi:hypothetical protein